MTPWILMALLLQFAAPATKGRYDIVLDVDVYRGAVRTAFATSPATPPGRRFSPPGRRAGLTTQSGSAPRSATWLDPIARRWCSRSG
jgi:hypothetical protein